jgi:ribosomal protein L37AE/L43A
MDELKPCPFCGSDDVKQYMDTSIHCRQCGAEGGYSWNYRPIEDKLNARIKELEAELKAEKDRFKYRPSLTPLSDPLNNITLS